MARCFPFPPKGYVKAAVLAEQAMLQEEFKMDEERSMKQERKEKKRKVLEDSDINYNGNLEEKETKRHKKKHKHSEKSKNKQCSHDETSKRRSGHNDVPSGESKSKNGGFDDDSLSGKSKTNHSGFGGSNERSSARIKYDHRSRSDVAEDIVRFTESRSEKSNSKYERSKEKSDKIGGINEAVSECANAKFKIKVSQKDSSKDSVITRADSSDKSENTPMLLSNVLSERSKANAHKYALNGTLTQANQEQQKQIKNGTVEKGMALWSNLPVLTDKDRQNKRLLQTLNEELPKGSAKRSSGSPATSMKIMKSQDCALQIVGSKKKVKKSSLHDSGNAYNGSLKSQPTYSASSKSRDSQVVSETKESRKMSEIHPVNQSACDESGTKATKGTSLPSLVSLSTCNQNIKQSDVQSGTNASKGMPLPSPLSFRLGKRKMASADIEHDTQRSNKISKTQKAESFSYKKIQDSERKISENDERMVLSGDHVNQATDAASIPGDQATDAHGCSRSSLRGDHEAILTGVSGDQAAEATGVRGDQATSTSGNDATGAFNDNSFLPLPRMQEFMEYDDQSWLLPAKEKTSSTKKVLQSKEEIRVWDKAVFLPAVNVYALPFVLPY